MKFHFDLGTMIALCVFAAGLVWVAPAIIQIATFQDQIKLKQAQSAQEVAQLESASQLQSAQAQEKIKTLPTLTALDVQSKQAAIEAERAKANAQVNAQLIEAQGVADRERASGQAFVILAGAFILACILVAGYFSLREIVSAQTTRTVIEIAAREGGRLELPNGHAVTFLPSTAHAAMLGTGVPLAEQRAEVPQIAERARE